MGETDTPLQRGEKLSVLAYQKIESMILSGELCPGERFNEYQFAVRHGLSRGPVREACRALERDGLLTAVPAKGVFVREVSDRHLEEIYDLRALLTGFMCQLAAQKVGPEQVWELRRLNDKMGALSERKDTEGYYGVNLVFHGRIGEIADSETAKRTYDGLVKETHAHRIAVLSPNESIAEHECIIDAFARNDALLARQLGEDHVLSGKARWQKQRADFGTETENSYQKKGLKR